MAARVVAEFPGLNYETLKIRIWEFIDLIEPKPKTEGDE
jgi:hypothetical protein